jgi:hypothetical protein
LKEKSKNKLTYATKANKTANKFVRGKKHSTHQKQKEKEKELKLMGVLLESWRETNTAEEGEKIES